MEWDREFYKVRSNTAEARVAELGLQVQAMGTYAQEVEAELTRLCSSMSFVGEVVVESFRSYSAYRDELTAVALEFYRPARNRGFRES